jgi:hypothetical protein
MASDQPASLSSQLPEPISSSVHFSYTSVIFLSLTGFIFGPTKILASGLRLGLGVNSCFAKATEEKEACQWYQSTKCVSDLRFRCHAYIDSTWTQAKAKKAKVYENHGIQDYLQSDLDSTLQLNYELIIPHWHNFIVVFCGMSPGKKSSQIGHHYANPTNHFWSCLHQSGKYNYSFSTANMF